MQPVTNNRKIRQIPTELNYINYTNARLNSHNKRINYVTRFTLILFIWCAVLTGYLIHNQIQTKQTKLNNEILIQELIPIDDYEVIGD